MEARSDVALAVSSIFQYVKLFNCLTRCSWLQAGLSAPLISGLQDALREEGEVEDTVADRKQRKEERKERRRRKREEKKRLEEQKKEDESQKIKDMEEVKKKLQEELASMGVEVEGETFEHPKPPVIDVSKEEGEVGDDEESGTSPSVPTSGRLPTLALLRNKKSQQIQSDRDQSTQSLMNKMKDRQDREQDADAPPTAFAPPPALPRKGKYKKSDSVAYGGPGLISNVAALDGSDEDINTPQFDRPPISQVEPPHHHSGTMPPHPAFGPLHQGFGSPYPEFGPPNHQYGPPPQVFPNGQQFEPRPTHPDMRFRPPWQAYPNDPRFGPPNQSYQNGPRFGPPNQGFHNGPPHYGPPNQGGFPNVPPHFGPPNQGFPNRPNFGLPPPLYPNNQRFGPPHPSSMGYSTEMTSSEQVEEPTQSGLKTASKEDPKLAPDETNELSQPKMPGSAIPSVAEPSTQIREPAIPPSSTEQQVSSCQPRPADFKEDEHDALAASIETFAEDDKITGTVTTAPSNSVFSSLRRAMNAKKKLNKSEIKSMIDKKKSAQAGTDNPSQVPENVAAEAVKSREKSEQPKDVGVQEETDSVDKSATESNAQQSKEMEGQSLPVHSESKSDENALEETQSDWFNSMQNMWSRAPNQLTVEYDEQGNKSYRNSGE